MAAVAATAGVVLAPVLPAQAAPEVPERAPAASGCPYGSACLWNHNDNNPWVAPGCGWHHLPPERRGFQYTAQTHGNAMRLWGWNGQWVDFLYLQPWKQPNFVIVNTVETHGVTVYC